MSDLMLDVGPTAGDHSCHADCPCQRGEKPTPDFESSGEGADAGNGPEGGLTTPPLITRSSAEGEGPAATGPSPNLQSRIDQFQAAVEDSAGTIAVSELDHLSRIGYEEGSEALRDALREGVVPLTLARGAVLERSLWKTRIERLASECDRLEARHTLIAFSGRRSGRDHAAAAEEDSADLYHEKARFLRSLLAEDPDQ